MWKVEEKLGKSVIAQWGKVRLVYLLLTTLPVLVWRGGGIRSAESHLRLRDKRTL